MLAFVGSFGPKGPVSIQLVGDLGDHVDAGSRAFDAETGGSIARVAGGSSNFTFSLDKHSFKIVVVEL